MSWHNDSNHNDRGLGTVIDLQTRRPAPEPTADDAPDEAATAASTTPAPQDLGDCSPSLPA